MLIPAREIEAVVAECIAEALDDPIALTAKAGFTLHSGELRQTMVLAEQVRANEYYLIRALVSSVRVSASEIGIELSPGAFTRRLKREPADGQPDMIYLVAKVRLTRTGRRCAWYKRTASPRQRARLTQDWWRC